MSQTLRYTVSNEQPAQTRAERRDRSASVGIDVCLQGWRPGLNKVQLTKMFRDGGVGLSAASKLTGDILTGKEVCVRLTQFADIEAARAALKKLGVERIDLNQDS